MRLVEPTELAELRVSRLSADRDRLQLEVYRLQADLRAAGREKTRILELWTAERTRLLDDAHAAKARERAVRQVINLYSGGEA